MVKLLHQASSAGTGPLPATASGQVRGMTPPGSVIPRVTPTATDYGPDHHRTVGSLTVIPYVNLYVIPYAQGWRTPGLGS